MLFADLFFVALLRQGRIGRGKSIIAKRATDPHSSRFLSGLSRTHQER